MIKTLSIVDNEIENGCLLTFGNNYNSKKSVNILWDIINFKNNYDCAHLKIDGIFDGCILNYIKTKSCPGENNS